MSNIIVMGAQWGDEGKGKIVDLLTKDVDYIVRFQGGNNAGHTVIAGGKKYILHLIPSGILHPGKVCCIGNGVVLDPQVFWQELEGLRDQGIAVGPDRMIISKKTHLIMPYHKVLDAARETARTGDRKIGTTGRGIGPCYEDKMCRVGIRAADLTMPELLRAKIGRALREKNCLFESLYGLEPMDADQVFEEVYAMREHFEPYLGDVSGILEEAKRQEQNVLFEGAQGVLLDIDHGTYPFVTSSNTVAGGASAGSGCPVNSFDRIIAIVKAYTTRVGGGPFPTELFDEQGKYLQEKGAEFGATTGRERRCGWLDAVVLREAVRLNGPTDIALTKLDVLGGLDQIGICVGYEYNGERIDYPPQEQEGLSKVTPIYEYVPGWKEDISQLTSWSSLPRAARDYVARIERLVGVPVSIVSVGPDREQTLIRK